MEVQCFLGSRWLREFYSSSYYVSNYMTHFNQIWRCCKNLKCDFGISQFLRHIFIPGAVYVHFFLPFSH